MKMKSYKGVKVNKAIKDLHCSHIKPIPTPGYGGLKNDTKIRPQSK